MICSFCMQPGRHPQGHTGCGGEYGSCSCFCESARRDRARRDAERRADAAEERRQARIDEAWNDLGNTLRDMGDEEPGHV